MQRSSKISYFIKSFSKHEKQMKHLLPRSWTISLASNLSQLPRAMVGFGTQTRSLHNRHLMSCMLFSACHDVHPLCSNITHLHQKIKQTFLFIAKKPKMFDIVLVHVFGKNVFILFERTIG